MGGVDPNNQYILLKTRAGRHPTYNSPKHMRYIFPEFENIGEKKHLHIFVQKARQPLGKKTQKHISPQRSNLSEASPDWFHGWIAVGSARSVSSLLPFPFLLMFSSAFHRGVGGLFKKKGRKTSVWVKHYFGNLRNSSKSIFQKQRNNSPRKRNWSEDVMKTSAGQNPWLETPKGNAKCSKTERL